MFGCFKHMACFPHITFAKYWGFVGQEAKNISKKHSEILSSLIKQTDFRITG